MGHVRTGFVIALEGMNVLTVTDHRGIFRSTDSEPGWVQVNHGFSTGHVTRVLVNRSW